MSADVQVLQVPQVLRIANVRSHVPWRAVVPVVLLVAIAPSLADAADRAAVLPTDWQLARLARLVAARERRYGRSVDTVRIEPWRIEYEPASLTASSRLAREFLYRVEPTTCP